MRKQTPRKVSQQSLSVVGVHFRSLTFDSIEILRGANITEEKFRHQSIKSKSLPILNYATRDVFGESLVYEKRGLANMVRSWVETL